MRHFRLIAIASIFLLAGCLVNQWHEESYFDRLAYQYKDAASMRDDLDRTLKFLPTIGLKPLEEQNGSEPATEAVFIRNGEDHFHVTVTVRGLAQINGSGWTMIVRVDSYNIGEEGAIGAGKSLLERRA